MPFVEYKNSVPALAIRDYLGSVASQAAMLALLDPNGLIPQKGDWCYRSDLTEYWVVTGIDATQLSSWTSQGGSGGSVDWTAITSKPSTFAPSTHAHPISEVTNLQTTLDGKEPTIGSGTSGQYIKGNKTLGTLDKTAVGLTNVDNTSDSTKNSATATITNKSISGSDNTLSNIPQSAVTNLATDLGNKQATITGAATTIDTEDLTISRAVISNASGKIAVSSVTDTELGYVSGATSNIQSQLGNKQPLDSTLTALAAYNSNGILVQTAPDTFTPRTIIAGTGISVSNGDGVSGNPVVALTGGGIPIGAIRSDIGLTAVKVFYDTLYTSTKGMWLRNGAVTTPTSIISANYPDITSDTADNNISNRTWLWLASSNYGFARFNATCIQTTTDFSTYTNREIEAATVVPTSSTGGYLIDYDGTRTVMLQIPSTNSSTGFIGYSYSNNGTTFTSVYGRAVSGVYTVLSNPCISGSTYSFWSSIDNARIYTTDHTNWTVCTNSINAPVHKMNNGTLYCTTSSGTDFKYSTDNGQTWTTGTLPSALGANENVFHSIDFDGTNYVYVKGTTTVYYGTTLAFGSTATFTASKNQVWFRNAAFIATTSSQTTAIETCTNPNSWTQRTLPNTSRISYVLYAHSKYFVLGDDRVMSSSDLASWTSEIASGITQVSATAMPQTFACATGNNLVFISSGTINIYQSGSWTAVTNSQQNTGLATLSLGIANVFTKVRL